MRIIGLILVLVSLPVFIALLQGNRRNLQYAALGLGLFPFVVDSWNLDASLVSWAAWPGYSKGIIISLLDSLCIAILATGPRIPFYRAPMLGVFVSITFAAALGALFSSQFTPSTFVIWDFFRMTLIFLATVSVVGRLGSPKWVIYGFGMALGIQAFYVIRQVLGGHPRPSGTVGHQNLLGIMSYCATLGCLSLVVNKDRYKLLLALAAAGGLFCVSMGASRASLGFSGLAVGLFVMLSLIRDPKPRTIRFAAIGAALLVLAAPFAVASLQDRFEGSLGPSNPHFDHEREAFERAANLMWTANPMGVGPNMYVVEANTGGYSDEAGVIWNASSRATNVHNSYLLAAAEMGYIGFIALIMLLVYPMIVAFRAAWRGPPDGLSSVLLAQAVALLAISLHAMYEWALLIHPMLFVLAVSIGIVSGTLRLRQRGPARAAARKAVRNPARSPAGRPRPAQVSHELP